ncbi:MAG: SusD/RagB family nutrient-binding outer membrane lipoprotein [Bacteroidota bacterium]
MEIFLLAKTWKVLCRKVLSFDIRYSFFNNVFLLLFLLVLFTGCKKNLTELNVNPNDPLTTDPNYLFRYALQQGMGNYNSDVTVQQWSIENWIMYMAARGGPEPGKEYILPSGKDDLWNEQYANALANTQAIINLVGDDPESVNMVAAAMIWKVYLFQRITDLWGDVPYSESLKGISELNLSPAYDSQKDIYYDMLATLKTAAALFNDKKKFFDPGADLFYQGSMILWIKLANSLRLRLATHLNKADYPKYQQVLQELTGQPLISSNLESAIFPYNGMVKNHLYETMFRGESVIQNNPSKFLADLLVSTNDPRVSLILEKAPLSFLPIFPPYNGVPNLLLNTNPLWSNYNRDGDWGEVSRVGNWFLRNETPGVVMEYAEVCFLKAEAALNGLWPGNAGDLMKEGVRADIAFYELYGGSAYALPQEKVDQYLAALPTINLESVITQKWISNVFENGYESWADYRRTGYPVLREYYGNPIDASLMPVRMTWPYREYTLNQAHYNEAVVRQGANNQFTHVWWNRGN